MNSIPLPVIRRFPAYLRALNEFSRENISWTTSSALGKHMGASPSQVRQDFSALISTGQQGTGYDIIVLRKALEDLAGLGRAVNAVMVGTEAMGLALLKSDIPGRMNVSIREIFSEDACTPEEEYQTLHFQTIDAFPAFIRSAPPDLVILNTAEPLARRIMDLAVSNGVPAVWNLTEKDLLETENTLVENLGQSDSILFLNARRIALENGSSIPVNVLKRMPGYLRKLQDLIDRDTASVTTSSELGRQLGITPSQVRQDLNFLGPSGSQGIGYDVPELCRKIGALLGLDEVASCAQIGQGMWSRTFADPFFLACCGLDLTAVFETGADAQQELSCGEADLAIVDVSDRKQVIPADALKECGIKAVWNLSEFDLVESADCELVENFHPADSLFILLCRDYLRRNKEDPASDSGDLKAEALREIRELQQRYPDGWTTSLGSILKKNLDLHLLYELNNNSSKARKILGVTLAQYLRNSSDTPARAGASSASAEAEISASPAPVPVIEGNSSRKQFNDEIPQDFEILKRRYPDGSPYLTAGELLQHNPDLDTLKDLRLRPNKAKALLGISLQQYLVQEGILCPDSATAEAMKVREPLPVIEKPAVSPEEPSPVPAPEAPKPAPAPKSPALPVPDSGDGPYAFLSYSHRNTEKAMEIIRMLQENGYRIWFDDEIEGGTGWRDSLATKIEGCSVFVLLMSEEYQKSKYCKRELYFADTNDKPMLQISIDGTPLSSEFKFILGGIQAIRLSSSPDHKFLEKLRKIEALHAIKAR